ncbi:hypothetical protein C9374_000623 [Naegleria lovaniensis]|uniref:Uncharacterized protein n=1 Tax=Naegleria lovaniensis TaxID=51637 RepID=A0AA88GZD3_NAELO|nr:uncharacterized protein C9374_000623 [Naegleria lovaniensis]KAG2388459.1 hypothetical protein C9374_000623 [Naegleria lovaniensis]
MSSKLPLHPMYEEYRDSPWVFFLTDRVVSVLSFVEKSLRSIPLFGRLYALISPTTRVAPMTAKTNPPPRPGKMMPVTAKEKYEPNSNVPRKNDWKVVNNYGMDVNEYYEMNCSGASH